MNHLGNKIQNEELQRIENFTASTQDPDITNVTGLLSATEFKGEKIYDPTQSTFIEFDATGVNVNGDFTVNGSPLTGDVVGPVSSTENALVRWDGTSGNLVKDITSVTLSDSGTIDFPTNGGIKSGINVLNMNSNGDMLMTTGPGDCIRLNTETVKPAFAFTDIGDAGEKFRDLYMSGSAFIDTNLTVGGFIAGAAGSDLDFWVTQSMTFRPNNTTTLELPSAGGVLPGGDGVNDLGASNRQFRDLHLSGTITGSVSAFDSSKGTNNMSAGTSAGALINTGTFNLVCGNNAGTRITSATRNTMLGHTSGTYITGDRNTCVGGLAGVGVNAVSTCADNTFIGASSGNVITTGGFNACIGSYAGDGITTGSNNTVLGAYSDVSPTGSNQTAIGYQAVCDTPNQITLGNSSVSLIRPTGNGVADLGDATHKYKNGYFSGSLNCGSLTFPKPFAEMYEGTSSTTSGLTDNVWYKALFTNTLSGLSQSFTHTSPNKLTYNGIMARVFHSGCTITCYPDSNSNSNWEFALSVNGVIQSGSIVSMTTSNNAHRYSTAIHKIFPLQTNDYVELYMRRTSGTSNLTINHFNLFMLAMPNEFSPSELVPDMTNDTTPIPYVGNASSITTGYPAYQLFDVFDTGDGWVSFAATFNNTTGDATISRNKFDLTQNMEWITIDLGSVRTITRFDFINGSLTAASPVNFVMHVSDTDTASSWSQVYTKTGESWTTLGQVKQYPISITTRYIGFSFTKIGLWDRLSLATIKIWGL
jgi:hypothetical protein